MGESMSLLAMIFFIFLSVNTMVYMAMTAFQTFLAVIYRVSTIFEMSEYESIRNDNVPKEKAEVTFENVSVTWGFKI
jgi:hypothetical protein